MHSDGRLHTCDLDLVSEEGKEYFKPLSAKFLNNKCADIFAKRGTNGATYNLYLAEANAFREFIIAIETYEAKKSGKKLCANNEVSVLRVLVFYLYTITHALEGAILLRSLLVLVVCLC